MTEVEKQSPKVYRPIKCFAMADYDNKCSVEVPETKKDGETSHYRHPKYSDMQGEYGRVTLPELFESGLAQSANKPCLGHREVVSTEPLKYADKYTWQTYAQVDKRRKALGSALEALFKSGKLVASSDFEGVGIWSINRPEWQIVDLACQAYGKCSVALYDTLGPESVEYVINHSELSVIFCSENHIQQLLNASANCPVLKMIVSVDTLEGTKKVKYVEAGKDKGIDIKELKELEEEGAKNLLETKKVELDDIASICYTSGTSGTPKGVVVTQRSLGAACLCHIHGAPLYEPNFTMFSYLPLAHSYGRCFENVVLGLGGRIGYYTGNPLNLMEDVQCLKPQVFPAVPRVLNRIYNVAMSNVRAPGLKGSLFRRAVETKLANWHNGGSMKHWLWDRLVFNKVQTALGGRVTLITVGGAPMNSQTMDFFKVAFGCEVLEGYGLTETMSGGSRTLMDDPEATGTIGGVHPVNEYKLVDVPELNYSVNDKPNARGELCIRGDNVFKKYYKDEVKTAEAIDSDGFLHTGDVAEVDGQGRFKIIDRVKNIMKLSQGEYVALEKIENVYVSAPVIAQIYIHGDSLKDHLVAVVVPDAPNLALIAEEAGHPFDATNPQAVEAAIKEEAVKKAVLDNINAQSKKIGNLKGFEVVKAIHLTTEQFTVENDTLTPTFKIKRRQAYTLHKDAVDALYAPKATA